MIFLVEDEAYTWRTSGEVLAAKTGQAGGDCSAVQSELFEVESSLVSKRVEGSGIFQSCHVFLNLSHQAENCENLKIQV